MKPVPADKKKSLGKLPSEVRNKMGFMKKGGNVKGYAPGGDVSKDKKDPGFTKEFKSRVKKDMSPKERKDAEKRDAYEIGLRNKKKGGIRGAASQTIDNVMGVGRGTASERKELKKGYEDMKKAQKAKKLKHGGAVKGKKCRMDGIAVRGRTRAKQRSK